MTGCKNQQSPQPQGAYNFGEKKWVRHAISMLMETLKNEMFGRFAVTIWKFYYYSGRRKQQRKTFRDASPFTTCEQDLVGTKSKGMRCFLWKDWERLGFHSWERPGLHSNQWVRTYVFNDTSLPRNQWYYSFRLCISYLLSTGSCFASVKYIIMPRSPKI